MGAGGGGRKGGKGKLKFLKKPPSNSFILREWLKNKFDLILSQAANISGVLTKQV